MRNFYVTVVKETLALPARGKALLALFLVLLMSLCHAFVSCVLSFSEFT